MPKGKKVKEDDDVLELSDTEFWQAARTYQSAGVKAKKIGEGKEKAALRLVQEMVRRKLKTVKEARTGRTVTLVQNETVIYDPEAIWKDASARIRPHLFDRSIELGELEPDVRKAVLELVLEGLSPSQKKRVVKYRLNQTKLLRAVQEEIVTAKWVADRTRTEKSKPFVRVTGGPPIK